MGAIEGTFWGIVGFSVLVGVLVIVGIIALLKYLFTPKK